MSPAEHEPCNLYTLPARNIDVSCLAIGFGRDVFGVVQLAWCAQVSWVIDRPHMREYFNRHGLQQTHPGAALDLSLTFHCNCHRLSLTFLCLCAAFACRFTVFPLHADRHGLQQSP